MTKEELRKKINAGYEPTAEDYLSVMPKAKREACNAINELHEIKKWFKDNDWKVNKIIVKEWTEDDPRWLSYVKERKEKRERQDQLRKIIDNYRGDDL